MIRFEDAIKLAQSIAQPKGAPSPVELPPPQVESEGAPAPRAKGRLSAKRRKEASRKKRKAYLASYQKAHRKAKP